MSLGWAWARGMGMGESIMGKVGNLGMMIICDICDIFG